MSEQFSSGPGWPGQMHFSHNARIENMCIRVGLPGPRLHSAPKGEGAKLTLLALAPSVAMADFCAFGPFIPGPYHNPWLTGSQATFVPTPSSASALIRPDALDARPRQATPPGRAGTLSPEPNPIGA
jgi:hypothetical protein